MKKLEEALQLKMKMMDNENKKEKAALKALQKEQTQKK
jgi:hypothetical protein